MSPLLNGSNSRTSLILSISDPSMVGEARRTAQAMARALSLGETSEARIGIIATELGTNLSRHAKDGQIHLRSLPNENGLEILAIDSGPGMDVQRCLVDGFSSRSTMGGGLGAIQRQSDRFDVYSQIGQGTVVLSHVGGPSSLSGTGHDVGVICATYPGENYCGDGWLIRVSNDQILALVVDGLGHGVLANQAAEAAIEIAERSENIDPEYVIKLLHGGLRATRGAAASIGVVDKASHHLAFAGVGNVRGCVARDNDIKGLVTYNGTLGLQIRSVRKFTQDFSSDDLLIVHSDGISAKWDLADYPGLAQRSAGVIAGAIYRDWRRANDDATILVLRLKPRWLKGN